ncbi:MAG: ABC transporter permease [Oscillospiraceae bacterium]|nr:ABC transporter permease [Oscillospiraceae bacterium]
MNKIIAFSKRNFLEIIRDPLSYIFCLGFPLVMLVVMTLVNDTIPEEAHMELFRIQNLSGGIAVFGMTFVMLFVCLSVAKDRSGAFLVRLYATPMKSGDFISGYILPTVVLAVLQSVITFAASLVVALIVGVKLNILGILIAIVSLIPSMIMFISFGLLFGTLFSEKAAPGLCSIIISLGSFLGGIWFDVKGAGGVLEDICNALPFYHSVNLARMATVMEFNNEFFVNLLITVGYALVVAIVSVIVFKYKMRADLK